MVMTQEAPFLILQELNALRLQVAEMAQKLAQHRLEVALNAPISIKDVKYAVCRTYGVSITDLKNTDARYRAVYKARQVGVYLCCQLTGKSVTSIADGFGYKSHSTVCVARENVRNLRECNPEFDAKLRRIELELQAKQQCPTK